jgi:hypothetical protein
MAGGTWRGRAVMAPPVAAAAAVALVLHAAQPLSRGLGGIAAGTTVPLDAPDGLPGARIAMERQDQETYRRLLAIIAAHAAPGEPILALPMNPELYFLSRRPAPFRFHSTAIGIRDEAALASVLEAIDRAPPPVVIHRPHDKYNTAASLAIVERIRSRYELRERVGPFDVYLPR